MVVGNTNGKTRVGNGLKFVCLRDKGTRFPELDDFPKMTSQASCPAGIMTVHHFPA